MKGTCKNCGEVEEFGTREDLETWFSKHYEYTHKTEKDKHEAICMSIEE